MEFNVSSSEIINLGEKNSHHLLGQSDWYAEVSFMAHVIAYFIIAVWVAISIYLIVKCAGACDPAAGGSGNRWPAESVAAAAAVSSSSSSNRWPAEAEPMFPRKESAASTYGTMTEEEEEEDPELGRRCCTSEDLYEGKTCVICYDAARSCFFTPCGHSVACAPCARRIMEEENKLCPICRRLIHKVRKLRSTTT